jgi:hypothetical protein
MARVPDRKPALRFVFFVVLLDLLGIGLLIPVGPKLVTQLSGGSEADAAPLVGWLGATFSIMAFLCAPLLGAPLFLVLLHGLKLLRRRDQRLVGLSFFWNGTNACPEPGSSLSIAKDAAGAFVSCAG